MYDDCDSQYLTLCLWKDAIIAGVQGIFRGSGRQTLAAYYNFVAYISSESQSDISLVSNLDMAWRACGLA